MNIKYTNSSKSMRGLSLIEVLVALFIGSLLVLGALQLYLNVFRGDKVNTKLARMQEDGRVLTELLARYARRAGYQGCVKSTSTTTFTNASGTSITYPKDAIVAENSNSIQFRYAKPNPAGTFPNQTCDRKPLSDFFIKFENKGDSIHVTNSDFGDQSQELVKNARFTKISYIEPCSTNNTQSCYTSKPSAKTSHIEITTEIRDPKGEVATKTFRTSVVVRNRSLPSL